MAVRPSLDQVSGAGALARIGFVRSLFIAGQAFPTVSDFAAAKITVFAAPVLSSIVGVALLWGAAHAMNDDDPTTPPLYPGAIPHGSIEAGETFEKVAPLGAFAPSSLAEERRR